MEVDREPLGIKIVRKPKTRVEEVEESIDLVRTRASGAGRMDG